MYVLAFQDQTPSQSEIFSVIVACSYAVAFQDSIALFQWKKGLRQERKRELEKGRTVRRSPRTQEVKQYYKETSSEEEVAKKKMKIKSPKGKKVGSTLHRCIISLETYLLCHVSSPGTTKLAAKTSDLSCDLLVDSARAQSVVSGDLIHGHLHFQET